MKSEFGKGLTYCLGLFLAHAERYEQMKRTYENHKEFLPGVASMWFNGASDHFYELYIPNNLPENIKKRLSKLRETSLDLGHGTHFDKATEKDVLDCLDEAKNLLLEIDKFWGVEVEKGEFE